MDRLNRELKEISKHLRRILKVWSYALKMNNKLLKKTHQTNHTAIFSPLLPPPPPKKKNQTNGTKQSKSNKHLNKTRACLLFITNKITPICHLPIGKNATTTPAAEKAMCEVFCFSCMGWGELSEIKTKG